MVKEKFAVLDADFISKTHQIQKDCQNRLIDLIMEMKGYQFFCHEQIRVELDRDNTGKSSFWLKEMISNKKVHCISDEVILKELRSIYSFSAEAMYVTMFENGCIAYEDEYFNKHFSRLKTLNYRSISNQTFLKELKKISDDIGVENNLGELKSYVLLQMLTTKYGEKIYIFCSDDKNARNGIINLGNFKCINILSSFMLLEKEGILDKDEAKPYIRSYIDFCNINNQKDFKIYDSTKEMRIQKVNCEKVIEDMYAGKFELLKNGCLRYKS